MKNWILSICGALFIFALLVLASFHTPKFLSVIIWMLFVSALVGFFFAVFVALIKEGLDVWKKYADEKRASNNSKNDK